MESRLFTSLFEKCVGMLINGQTLLRYPLHTWLAKGCKYHNNAEVPPTGVVVKW